jgi:alpha-tubulin suppressor-like RCC1 family protein
LLCSLTACEEQENGITGPCGFGDPCAVDPIASVQLPEPGRSLVPGDTLTLNAVVMDSSGTPLDVAVTFSSEDSSIATVSPAGLVHAVAPGNTVVTARAGAREASVDLDVLALLAAGVSAGEDAGCIVTNVPGRAQCWGLGDAGQLGFQPDTTCFADDGLISGPLACAIVPGLVGRDLNLTSISVGDSLGCALAADGAAYCWGDNQFGQLGTGGLSGVDGSQRVTAPGGSFTVVSAGGRHACGIAGGSTYCWGEDSVGQLGDARRINSTTPIPVVTAESFTSITAGLRHTCALNSVGAAFCWGNNESGQLGVGGVGGDADVPASVTGGHTYLGVAAGDSSSCGLRADGAVFCWGANTHGQLGRGSSGGAFGTPALVAGGSSFTSVVVGAGFACAIGADGDAYCWGRNSYGQLGSAGGNAPTPRAVNGGLTLTSLSAGSRHTCGLTAAGAVHCWGSNVFGALGNGLQAAARGMPVAVSLSN